jgi:hypothetical protein
MTSEGLEATVRLDYNERGGGKDSLIYRFIVSRMESDG